MVAQRSDVEGAGAPSSPERGSEKSQTSAATVRGVSTGASTGAAGGDSATDSAQSADQVSKPRAASKSAETKSFIDAAREEIEAAAAKISAEDTPGGTPDNLFEQEELAAARAETEELRDRFLRLQAEWDNYRKRTATERAEERSRATENLVEKLLPVVDDLERALDHAEASIHAGSGVGSIDSDAGADAGSETIAFVAGIQAVRAKLITVLEKEGVCSIDPKGQPFDANLHSAVGTVEDPSKPEETVAEVYQKGYQMGNRVIRPAMVVVTN